MGLFFNTYKLGCIILLNAHRLYQTQGLFRNRTWASISSAHGADQSILCTNEKWTLQRCLHCLLQPDVLVSNVLIITFRVLLPGELGGGEWMSVKWMQLDGCLPTIKWAVARETGLKQRPRMHLCIWMVVLEPHSGITFFGGFGPVALNKVSAL